MRLWRRAATALLLPAAMVMATAAVLAVSKKWLVALVLRVGIAERGQSSLEAFIDVDNSVPRSDCGRSCHGRLSSTRSRSLALTCSERSIAGIGWTLKSFFG